MDIKILEEVYWGYSKLAVVVDAALKKLNYNYKFQIIASPYEISKYNISKTPALIVNNQIIVEGEVPSVLDMMDILGKINKAIL